MRSLNAKPLTPESFAPFGSVVAAAEGEGKAANQGSAARFARLCDFANHRPASAVLDVSVFRCAPRSPWPFHIGMLEKHPESSQLFVPMGASRYIVVVARPFEGRDAPDASSLEAFVATGLQGVMYAPGTWHHPMIALDRETHFTCIAWEDGTTRDCVEAALPEAYALELPA